MNRKAIDPDIIKVCKSVSAYTSSKWHGVITFDDALSECYMWLATSNHLEMIEQKKINEPSKWRNSLAFSLKNEIARLGQKEVDYYSKNNGAIQDKLEELETSTEYLKDENSFLQTKHYYNNKSKLENLLFFVEHDATNIDVKEWETKVPYIDYRDAQAVVTELKAIYYSLTKNQQKFIKEKHIIQMSEQEIADANKIKVSNIVNKNNRIVRLIKLKLQQTNMVW